MIFFDLDDTLYDQMMPFKKAYEEIFKTEPFFESVNLNALFEQRQTYANEAYALFLQEKLTKKEMLCYRLTRAFEALGLSITNKQALAFQKAYQVFQGLIELDQEMEKVLDYCLEQEIEIAILSNGETLHQWEKVERLGLRRWFPKERIFVSADVGFDKPDLRLFESVLERLHLQQEDCCLVGDNFQNDIVGAKNAGWRCVFLNKYQMAEETEYVPDFEISQTAELLPLIDQLVSVKVTV